MSILLVWCRESVADNAWNEHKVLVFTYTGSMFVRTIDVHFLEISVKRVEICWDYKFNCKLRVYTIVLCVLFVLSFIIAGNKCFIKYNLYLKCS